jgi:gliding motility-associated lipoprotein GldH
MTRTKRIKSALLVVVTGFLCAACDSNLIYEENFSVDNNEWHKDDIKTFKFDIEDTLSPLNLYINMRTTTDYEFSNIYLFLYSDYPDGYSDKDTLEFIIAKPNGEWLGENSGTVVENKVLISKGGRFSTKGEYNFRIEHAMREDVLKEIIDVGFRVEFMEAE